MIGQYRPSFLRSWTSDVSMMRWILPPAPLSLSVLLHLGIAIFCSCMYLFCVYAPSSSFFVPNFCTGTPQSRNDMLSLVIAEKTCLHSLDMVTPSGVLTRAVLAAPELPLQSYLVSTHLLPSPGYSASVQAFSRPSAPSTTQPCAPRRQSVRCHYCQCLEHAKSECCKLQRAQQSGQQRALGAPSTHFSAMTQSFSVSEFAQQIAQKLSHGYIHRSSASVLSPDASDVSVSQPTASAPTGISPSGWLLDSGVSFYLTYDAIHLLSYQPVSSDLTIMVANDTILLITNRGLLHTRHFHVPNVAYIDKLSMNFISVSQLTSCGCLVIFDEFVSYAGSSDRNTPWSWSSP
ncbi:hypothetical protein KSP39_PZI004354 [Platanthera zijinensis]|uniref:Retrovirus-related Pol polyprotein from transposon TNT 1-94-like beta-barrel domain-containing protein n=1 Tax=Platanthera zijinensis TaxID=2320716 RepID=A0AAP0BV88_9ASPA